MNMGTPLILIIPSNDGWYESTTWLKKKALFIQDGRTAALQMLHFIYFLQRV